MADVTVLGAGGSTVTIALNSTENAAAAQTALKFVSKQVDNGILDQFTYPGTGTVPAPSNLLGGLIISGTTDQNAGALVSQYVSAVVNSTGKTTIVGTSNSNATVVAGDGSALTYLNLASNAKIFLGAGNHFVQQSTVTAGAQINIDKGATYIDAKIAGTNTTINAFDKSLTLIEAGGNVKVNVQSGSQIVAVQGNSTVPVTVTGTSGSLEYLALGGKAIINPGAANVTVFGNVGKGTATVFGTSAVIDGKTVTAEAFTGKLTLVDGQGYFIGGTGGGNRLFTSTVTGSATLQGGGTGDLLFSRGAGQVLIAGAGAETLTGFVVDASVGGSTFFSGGGDATIFGNTGGGNIFGLGAGLSLIDGRDEGAITKAGLGTGKANTFFDAAPGGTHLVSDFVSGLDTFNLSISTGAQSVASLKFFNTGDAGSPFTKGAGTELKLSGGTTILFFDTNVKSTDITGFKA